MALDGSKVSGGCAFVADEVDDGAKRSVQVLISPLERTIRSKRSNCFYTVDTRFFGDGGPRLEFLVHDRHREEREQALVRGKCTSLEAARSVVPPECACLSVGTPTSPALVNTRTNAPRGIL